MPEPFESDVDSFVILVEVQATGGYRAHSLRFVLQDDGPSTQQTGHGSERRFALGLLLEALEILTISGMTDRVQQPSTALLPIFKLLDSLPSFFVLVGRDIECSCCKEDAFALPLHQHYGRYTRVIGVQVCRDQRAKLKGVCWSESLQLQFFRPCDDIVILKLCETATS